MLEQKDLEVLQSMMESVLERRLGETTKSIESTMERRLEETTKSIESTMERRLGETTKSIESTMDHRLAESENLILEEMERTRGMLDDEIKQLQKNLEELNQYYKISKLEGDNTALFLKIVEGLSKRVDELERKTA